MTTLPATISFHDTELQIIDRNGLPWLGVTQIGLALGYANPKTAVTKIFNRNRDEFTEDMTATISTNTTGGKQDVRIFSPRGCHLIAMFARTKVAKEFRKWVLDVLDGLRSDEPAQQPKALPAALTPEQQNVIKALVSDRVKALPQDKQGKAAIKCWSALKSKFGCTYKEIPSEHFTEAASLVARIVLEGEYLAAETPHELPEEETVTVSKRRLEAMIRHVEMAETQREPIYHEIQALHHRLITLWSHLNEAPLFSLNLREELKKQ